MGRPLNKKFFGNRNLGPSGNNPSTAGAQTGGVVVSSLTTGGTLTGYTSGAPSISIYGAQMGNGVTATAVSVLTAAAASVTSGGSGYPTSSTFTVSVTGTSVQGGGTTVLNVTTNGSGVITTVNSITSGGTWTGATSSASALTAVGSTFTVAATFTLTSFTITSYSVTNRGAGYLYSSGISQTPNITAIDASNNITVSTVDELVPGLSFVPSQAIGGLTKAGTYYIKTVNTATKVITVSSSVTGAGVGATATLTAQPNSAALASFAYATSSTVSYTATTTALPVGTAITVGGSSAGTGTIGGSVPTVNTVYYIGAPSLTTTGGTLYATLANALASTSALTIVAGTGFGSLTFTYTVSTPTTITAPAPVATVSSGSATATVVTTTPVTSGYTGQYEAIIAQANIGGTIYEACDIVKQEGSRSYRVVQVGGSYPGTFCTLVTTTPTAGQMTIQATDSAGGTYYVRKLTGRKAYLVPITGSQFASGTTAQWNLTTAVINVSVVIDNG
jgi:hypothetical protein